MPQQNVGIPTPQMQPTIPHQDRPQFYPESAMQILMPQTQQAGNHAYFLQQNMPQTQLPFPDPAQWWHLLQQAHSMHQPQLQPVQQLAPPPESTASQTSLPGGSTTPAMVLPPNSASKSNETL